MTAKHVAGILLYGGYGELYMENIKKCSSFYILSAFINEGAYNMLIRALEPGIS